MMISFQILNADIIKAESCREDMKKCIKIAKEYREGKEICIQTLTDCKKTLEENNKAIEEMETERDSDVWKGRGQGAGATGILAIILLIIILL